MECINKTSFLREVVDYQPKTSAQSYLCSNYAEQKTEPIAPMECWPDD